MAKNRRRMRPKSERVEATTDDWRRRVRQWKETGIWMPQYGPSPDDPLSTCPKSVLAEFNIVGDG